MHFHLFFFFLLIHNQPPLLHPLPPPSHLCYLIILSSFQMGITSLQVCMDSSDWLQGTISEEGSGVESSPITTPTGGDEMLTCSRPLMERRLRPQHEQSLKCPRCDSTHTKFCYYNNYSLSQPRYFCKTCRRYWTKGGTLRNIPVGGGCRKNTKKPSSKKSDHSPSSSSPPLLLNHSNAGMSPPPPPLSYAPTDLHLAFPDQLHFASLHAAAGLYGATTSNYLLDNSHHHANPIDFMDNKYEALLGGHEGFVSNAGFEGVMAAAAQPSASDFHGVFGMSGGVDHGNPAILESCQRLMLPYDNHLNNEVVEAKPNAKILSLEWHDHQQACNSDAGKDSFGYSFGSWTGLMNGYGSSATNPLV